MYKFFSDFGLYILGYLFLAWTCARLIGAALRLNERVEPEPEPEGVYPYCHHASLRQTVGSGAECTSCGERLQ